MRLHRIFGSGLLAVALAVSAAAPADAAPSKSPIVRDVLDAAHVRLGDDVDYRASAEAATTEHYDARRSNDIVSTSLRFDTNLINVTVEAQGPIVVHENNWVAAQLSFNKSGSYDGMIIAGQESASSPMVTVAINRLGWECPAMSRFHDNKVTLSADAMCMGRPGAVAYNVLYGDFDAMGAGDYEAVDASPSDGGFTQPASERGGYWLLGADGGVFAFGDAGFYGSTGNMRLNAPVVSMAASSSGNGYRFVASDGGIFSYGDARFYGSMGGKKLNKPVVGMAPTKSGNGHWLVASDGGVFAFGDARFYGSMGGKALNKPIIAMTPTSSGNGYWMVASDGGVFAFGDAGFRGSMGGTTLHQPITAMAPAGDGYYMLAADGGVFAFGDDAPFYGSGVGRVLSATMAMANRNNGYLIADEIGGVYEVGSIFHFGDLVDMGVTPNRPIVGMAVLPE